MSEKRQLTTSSAGEAGPEQTPAVRLCAHTGWSAADGPTASQAGNRAAQAPRPTTVIWDGTATCSVPPALPDVPSSGSMKGGSQLGVQGPGDWPPCLCRAFSSEPTAQETGASF